MKILVRFFAVENEEEVAAREMYAVPRVGEYVIIESTANPMAYEVKSVMHLYNGSVVCTIGSPVLPDEATFDAA